MSIMVETGCFSDKDLEGEVDEDIDRFSRYFASLGNDRVSPFEKAIIKTYLFYKVRIEPSLEPVQQATQDDQSDS